jgi:hypothetical protein
LRHHRETLGYDLDDAATIIGCDRSKISRVENALRGIRQNELKILLDEYGVGQAEQAGLLALARPRGSGWWEEYADLLTPAGREYLGLESDCAQLWAYDGQQIPPLLRTEEYARILAEHDPAVQDGTADRIAVLTMLRQADSLGPGRDIVMVIGEAALRQRVGGPDVMLAQLARLADISERVKHTTILVLPRESGAHAAAGFGPLTIFRFAQGLDAIYVDSLGGGTFLSEPAEVTRHTSAFAHLRACALREKESARMLRRLADGRISRN